MKKKQKVHTMKGKKMTPDQMMKRRRSMVSNAAQKVMGGMYSK